MNAAVEKNLMGKEILRLYVSGSIVLSVIHEGDGLFEIAMFHGDKFTGDIVLCPWQDLFPLYDEVRNGVFKRFPRLHTRLMQES
jgi:hypothetical protein